MKTSKSIEERVESLEGSRNRWRVAALAALLAAFGVAAAPNARELVASSVSIVDAHGRSRIILDVDEGDQEARISIKDAEGTDRAVVSVYGNGTPAVSLRDAKGIQRSNMAVYKGGPLLLLFDKDGKELFGAPGPVR